MGCIPDQSDATQVNAVASILGSSDNTLRSPVGQKYLDPNALPPYSTASLPYRAVVPKRIGYVRIPVEFTNDILFVAIPQHFNGIIYITRGRRITQPAHLSINHSISGTHI